MDGLNTESFCLQDLVPSSSTTSDRSVARPEAASDSFDQATAAAAAANYSRFSAMQPFCHPPAGHFMSQPVQPLPLPYPQVSLQSHIPPPPHASYHSQPSQSSFNSMNGLRPATHHFSPTLDSHESPADYFDKSHQQQTVCPITKSLVDDKRKGESGFPGRHPL